MSADERIGSEACQQVAAELALRGGRMALDGFHRARNGADRRRDDVEPAGAVIADRLAAEIAAVYPGDAVLGAPARSTIPSRAGCSRRAPGAEHG